MAEMSNNYLQSNIQTIQWPKCQTITNVSTKQYTYNTMAEMSNNYLQSNIQTTKD